MARTATQLAPHSAPCYRMLARVLASSGSNLGEARAAADQAVSLAPQDASSYIIVGAVAAADARPQEAIAAFHRALALEPDNSIAHSELARLRFKKRRLGNAQGLAQAAGGFASALRSDPRARASRRNFNAVLHVFIARTATGIMMIASMAAVAYGGSDAASVRLFPALLLVFPAFFASRFVFKLTPTLRGHLMRLLLNPFVAMTVTCDAIAVSALVVGGAFQRASAIAFWWAAAFAILAAANLLLHMLWKFKWRPGPK
jgi:tetratricopeptide (TPR) repeat protein